MRVLLVNQYFHPDLAATAQIMTDLAVDLAARGAEVTAVTGRAPYVGNDRYGPREEFSGVHIRRPPTTSFGRGSIAGRMADYLSLYAGTLAELALLPHQDVVVTLSTPPLISLVGAAHRFARGSRFIYWVQDLYPDVAVQLGVLGKNSPMTWAMERLSRASLRSADAIVALGDAMADRLVAKGADRGRVHVVHNWSNGEVGSVPREKNWFLDKHGLRGKFVVLYSGNMGRGHEFETLLGAARELSAREDILFLFIGDGAKRGEVEAASRTLPNVRLLPYQKREDLPYSLGAGDLFAITLSDGLDGLIVPSKLYGALAAGQPVLFIGPQNSETAQVVSEVRCGGTFAHGDAASVAKYIERLAAQPVEVRLMGERARRAFENQYDRRISTARFAGICRSVCGQPAAVPQASADSTAA